MSEKKTIRALKNLKDGCIVCKHIEKVESLELGFHFPEDIETDFQVWCDECEKILDKEGEWTKKALKFADFKPYCSVCLWQLKEFYLEKLRTGKRGKYRLWG